MTQGPLARNHRARSLKVERPGVGDETRTWGPPFLRDPDGRETAEAGYYLSANRNKRSITVNFSKPDGAALVKRLLPRCDVLIENFEVLAAMLGMNDSERQALRDEGII